MLLLKLEKFSILGNEYRNAIKHTGLHTEINGGHVRFFFSNSSIRGLPFICLNKPLQNMKILPLNFALEYYMINSVLVFDSCMIKALVFAEE